MSDIREQIKWACLRSNAPEHMTNPELRDTMENMLAVVDAAKVIGSTPIKIGDLDNRRKLQETLAALDSDEKV